MERTSDAGPRGDARRLRVLLLEDSEQDAELILGELERGGYDVECERVQSADGMRAALERDWDLVLSDYSMPGFSGPEGLEVLRASGRDLPFIIVSGTIGEETAVKALKAGAHDFLVKDRLARLMPAIERELREAASRYSRRATERALLQSEAQYRSLVERAVFGIYRATIQGEFLTVNPALVRMLGYESAEALMRVPVSDLFADATARDSLIACAIDGLQIAGEEAIWRTRTGAHIRVRLSGGMIEPGLDRRSVFEAIVEEITERHRLEEQLRQARKMESIGRLAGGIAHDFNNILTTIVGYSEMMLDQIGADKPISGDLLEIRKAASRATELTRQLLAFGRKQTLQISPVDVNQVVRDAHGMLRRLVSEDITFDLALDDGLPLIVADQLQLQQVLLNLAANAGDAMPKGGALRIESAAVDHETVMAVVGSAVEPGQYVCLSVADTGHGMDARVVERIFEPFFTTKEPGHGTGLGLATVHGIVHQLGGHIGVASEVGRGTTFRMFFPAPDGLEALRVQPARKDVAAVPVAHEPGTVLVVEDEAPVRHLVARMLSRHGYKVLEAGGAEEGLAIARRGHRAPDLVISDVVMPDVGGAEFARRLHEIHPNVPVLFISGYTGETAVRRGDVEPDAQLLEKPFTARALLDAVEKLVRG